MSRSATATAAGVAESKRRHPEDFCPEIRCLWRTGGGRCPRHPGRALAHVEICVHSGDIIVADSARLAVLTVDASCLDDAAALLALRDDVREMNLYGFAPVMARRRAGALVSAPKTSGSGCQSGARDHLSPAEASGNGPAASPCGCDLVAVASILLSLFGGH